MQYTRAHEHDDVTNLEIEGHRVALRAAEEAIVLLENDGVLPMPPQRIALFGTGAEMTVAGGTGSGEVNVRHNFSVREGLVSADFQIATSERISAYKQSWEAAKAAFLDEQRAKMRRPTPKVISELIGGEFKFPADAPVTFEEAKALATDACVYVVSRQAGEGVDRTDEPGSFRLTEQELADIRTCASAFEKTIVVLNVGAPIDVSWRHDIEGVNAIVLMGQLGQQGGRALGNVLGGWTCPSGKLAVTWPESISQVPFSDRYGQAASQPDSADYAEGIYVGYRYYTSFGVKPAYLFGHGLSYASFEERVAQARLDADSVTLSVDVRNVGETHAGKHVVQVYASCPEGVLAKESRRLVAFAKTGKLGPGESERLEVTFGLRELASYDEERAQTMLEPGDYLVALGDTPAKPSPACVVRVAQRAVLEQHRNLCASERLISELVVGHGGVADDGYDAVPVLEVAYAPRTVRHEYGKTPCALPEVDALVDALSASQRLRFCIGTGMSDDGEGLCVPGAVGHTTAQLLDVGIPNLEMCDGPAGIRLQRRSAIDAKGAIKPIDAPLSFYELLPDLVKRHMFGDEERDDVVYQYVTGFPSASSVAQTWNVALAAEVGDQVGAEMEEFGVTYWLAPALNIVRNPLCGRTFEYYSEDPLVSGKMAAAVTRGVQSHPGRFACIKHFAANNQEFNRNTSSSNADERVLREVYLRGFEIVVREGHPASVMASYNLVNGVYATENADLLTGILRDEWGFDGVVMTDWFATGFGHADERKALEAGTDLIMPGGMLPLAKLSFALRAGRLSESAVRTACARVLSKTLATC